MSSKTQLKLPTDKVIPLSSVNESEIWDKFRNGCEKSLMIIFDQHIKILFKYGLKLNSDEALVKDCIQELFIDLWRRHKNLGATNSIKLYLFKSLRRKINREQSRPGNVFLDDLDETINSYTEPSHEITLINEQVSIEKRNSILSKVNLLSARQREAIFLRYFEELTYEEIASIMSLSRQSAYNLIHRALETLKQFFIISFFLLLTF